MLQNKGRDEGRGGRRERRGGRDFDGDRGYGRDYEGGRDRDFDGGGRGGDTEAPEAAAVDEGSER
jgi:hypothetical protein